MDGQTLRWQRRASLRCAANKTNPIDVTECPQSIPITANRLDIGQNRCVRKADGSLRVQISGEWGIAHQRLLASEN